MGKREQEILENLLEDLSNKHRFCEKGELPHVAPHDLKHPRERKEFEIVLEAYRKFCPCGPFKKDPGRIALYREAFAKTSGHKYPWFPNLYFHYGLARYDLALAILVEYRKQKGFHEKWARLRRVVKESSLSLTKGNQLVAVPNEKGEAFLKSFLTLAKASSSENIGEAGVTSIKKVLGELRSPTLPDIEKLGPRKALETVMTTVVENHVQMLGMIKRGVDNKELANKDFDSPESRDYRLRFFIKLATWGGENFLVMYEKYQKYDKLYWELLGHVQEETRLRRGTAVHDARIKKIPESLEAYWPPADQGVKHH